MKKLYYIVFCNIFYGVLPTIVFIIFSMFINGESDNYLKYNLIIHAVFAFVVSYFASLMLSYILSKNNPKSTLKIKNWIFPAVVSFLLNSAIFCFCAIESKGFIGSTSWLRFGVLNIGFWFNSYICIFTDELHYTLYVPMVYRLFVLIGFFIGHVQTVNKSDRVEMKKIISYVLVCSLLISTAAYSFELHDKNTVGGMGSEFKGIKLWDYNPTNPTNILPVLKTPSTFKVSGLENLPVLKGLEATYPLYSAFANACYDNYFIKKESGEEKGYDDENYTIETVLLKETITFETLNDNDSDSVYNYSENEWLYKSLIDGKIDIFFGTNVSKEHLQMAKLEGVELKITPIAKEAFVFMVNSSNTVENLTTEQLKKIYSRKINNWKQVDGADVEILPFQKTKNLASQNLMEKIMGETKLFSPLKEQYKKIRESRIREKNAEYRNSEKAIGYNFKFFVQMQNKNNIATLNKYSEEEIKKDFDFMIGSRVSAEKNDLDIKLLKIDGVEPTNENIINEKYPFTLDIYVVTVVNNKNPKVDEFVEWMLGEQGQELVEKVGYVPLKPVK